MLKRKLFSKVLFLIGISILFYPSFSDWWNSSRQSGVISRYEKQTVSLKEELENEILKQAEEYNKKIEEQGLFEEIKEEKINYSRLLSVNKDGMMGYIEIPMIQCRIPIYHGTEESVLQIGAGHMEGSSLPVGGEGTHCVLSGHRGLPSARLFTGLDRLKKGDLFCLIVLKNKLYYEVEQIRTVLPNETNQIRIESGRDLCTLVTCTPYGVNTHRLLITGRRTVIQEKEWEERTETGMKEEIQTKVFTFAKWFAVCLLIILFWQSSFVDARAFSEIGHSVEIERRYEIEIRYSFPGVEFQLYDGSKGEAKPQNKQENLLQAQVTDHRGYAFFKNLPPRNYVIIGTEHEKEGEIYRPVTTHIQIPLNEDSVSRKIIIEPKSDKYPKEDKTEVPKEESTVCPPEESPTAQPDNPLPEGMLPQTGQLWIPVLFCIGLGMLFILAGWVRKR